MPLIDKLGGALDDATDNFHLVHSAALLDQGLTHGQISRLVRARVLDRVVRGLYRVPGTQTPLQDIAAAVQRHRAGVASHTSALFLDGLDVAPPVTPHVTVPPGSSATTTLGRLHRSPLERVDVTRRSRVPVTTVARSLVDAAELLSTSRLAALLDESTTDELTTTELVLDAATPVERAPGRAGSGRLRTALGPWVEAIRPDSPAEATAIRRIVGFGLPVPDTQVTIRDETGCFVARVDLAWPDQQVLREYDSPRFHGPGRVEADEARRQSLRALGWAIDSIERRHLRPGDDGWLHELAQDLGVPVPACRRPPRPDP